MDILLWGDIETTGLNPRYDVVLEVAMVLTDHELNPLTKPATWLIDPTDFSHNISKMNRYVQEMHANSGLIDAIYANVDNIPLENFMVETLDAWFNDLELAPRTVRFAGSSVQFDRSFLTPYVTQVSEFFTHRNLDVSSVNYFMQNNIGAPFPEKPETKHRALSDICDSIMEYAGYLFFQASPDYKRVLSWVEDIRGA